MQRAVLLLHTKGSLLLLLDILQSHLYILFIQSRYRAIQLYTTASTSATKTYSLSLSSLTPSTAVAFCLALSTFNSYLIDNNNCQRNGVKLCECLVETVKCVDIGI